MIPFRGLLESDVGLVRGVRGVRGGGGGGGGCRGVDGGGGGAGPGGIQRVGERKGRGLGPLPGRRTMWGRLRSGGLGGVRNTHTHKHTRQSLGMAIEHRAVPCAVQSNCLVSTVAVHRYQSFRPDPPHTRGEAWRTARMVWNQQHVQRYHHIRALTTTLMTGAPTHGHRG